MPPIVTGSGRRCGRWRVTREMIPIFLYITNAGGNGIGARCKQIVCCIFFFCQISSICECDITTAWGDNNDRGRWILILSLKNNIVGGIEEIWVDSRCWWHHQHYFYYFFTFYKKYVSAKGRESNRPPHFSLEVDDYYIPPDGV